MYHIDDRGKTGQTKTEKKTAVFLAKHTETDRQQNFWNRNNTKTKLTAAAEALDDITLLYLFCHVLLPWLAVLKLQLEEVHQFL